MSKVPVKRSSSSSKILLDPENQRCILSILQDANRDSTMGVIVQAFAIQRPNVPVEEVEKQLFSALQNGIVVQQFNVKKNEYVFMDAKRLIASRKFRIGSLNEMRLAVQIAVDEMGEVDGSDKAKIEKYISTTFGVERRDSAASIFSRAFTALYTEGILVSVGGNTHRYKLSVQLPSTPSDGTVEGKKTSQVEPADQGAITKTDTVSETSPRKRKFPVADTETGSLPLEMHKLSFDAPGQYWVSQLTKRRSAGKSAAPSPQKKCRKKRSVVSAQAMNSSFSSDTTSLSDQQQSRTTTEAVSKATGNRKKVAQYGDSSGEASTSSGSSAQPLDTFASQDDPALDGFHLFPVEVEPANGKVSREVLAIRHEATDDRFMSLAQDSLSGPPFDADMDAEEEALPAELETFGFAADAVAFLREASRRSKIPLARFVPHFSPNHIKNAEATLCVVDCILKALHNQETTEDD